MNHTPHINFIVEFGEKDIPRVALAITAAIELSAWGDKGYSLQEATAAIKMKISHPNGGLSRDETKRRFNICMELVNIMRGDFKWSVSRIVDYLPYALRCKLDGKEWEPKDYKNSRWAQSEIC